MPITFFIPSPLRSFTDDRSEVEIVASAGTVGEALSALWVRYPGLRDRILTEQGNVREHVNVFVDEENIRYTGGLYTVVADGDKISIVPAVSGGNG
ncbi:MAG: MoaD family protein [Acidobacteria bacterium]|nr:MoaD family protein [Acidobacteriota bacterium]